MARILLFADKINAALTARTQLQVYGHEVGICLRESQILSQCKVDTSLVVAFLEEANPRLGSIVKQLRARGQEVGIMIFHPTATCAQVISMLSFGVDSFVSERCSNQEVAARVQAMLRRPPRSSSTALHFGQLVVDQSEHTAYLLGSEISLRRKEYYILHALVQAAGRTITRDQLAALGTIDGNTSYAALNTQISNLRSALSLAGGESLLETVHGVGYRLKEIV